MNYSEAKNKIHDASGCEFPEYWEWEKIDGVYYPHHIKEYKAIWERPEYDPKTEFVEPSFFNTSNGYNQEQINIALSLEAGRFRYLYYGHFIIRIK